MRVLLNENVLEAAKRRMRMIFEDFDGQLVVNVSGGKDSLVVMDLALETARELGRTPLPLFWIDQEAEWKATVDTVKSWMEQPDVEPYWLQVPFRIFNATSNWSHWLHAWDPEQEDLWVHPREPMAYSENVYGVDRFGKLFEAAMRHHFDGTVMKLAGVRGEESAARLSGLTNAEFWHGETWGKLETKGGQVVYTAYPIYDWSYKDVWKYIHDRGLPYNKVYDLMFRYGVSAKQMRVSNLHHETAVKVLFFVQEFEPETYARLTKRIAGVDMANKMGVADYFPEQLPHMFSDWREYRDYLLKNLIEPDWQEKMGRRFDSQDRRLDPSVHDEMLVQHVRSILVNDHEGILLGNFEREASIRQRMKGEAFKREEGAANGAQ